MNKEQKSEIVGDLSKRLAERVNFYLADISTMTVNDVNRLRRTCFEKGIELQMVKNTLVAKALEQAEISIDGLQDVLKGSSALMLSDNTTAPAKLIKEFRKTHARPLLKAAFIEQSFYVGDEQIDTLINLKSKEVLIGELVALLQSPMRNVIGSLQSSGQKIAGLLKTLSEKEAQA